MQMWCLTDCRPTVGRFSVYTELRTVHTELHTVHTELHTVHTELHTVAHYNRST